MTPGEGEGSLGAVVVTFHSEAEVADNLAALRPQVEWVFIVDNGSTEAELAGLRASALGPGLTLIENGENLGIATALNLGIRAAEAAGCQWVLLFDQDSRVTDGFAQQMLADFARLRDSRWGDRLQILVPRMIDKRTGLPLPASYAKEGLEVATTSGSLTPMAAFARFGMFRDELFIDQVDFEFSLRVRAAGGVIAESSAVLLHAPGEPSPFRFAGRMWFQSSNYSPMRRFYQERNRVWMMRRYGRRFPRFALGLAAGGVKEAVKLLLGERDRPAKLRAILRGLLDGVRGRMGRRHG